MWVKIKSGSWREGEWINLAHAMRIETHPDSHELVITFTNETVRVSDAKIFDAVIKWIEGK